MIEPSSSEEESDGDQYIPGRPDAYGLCLPPGYVLPGTTTTHVSSVSNTYRNGPALFSQKNSTGGGRGSFSTIDSSSQLQPHYKTGLAHRTVSPSPSSSSIERDREVEQEDEEEVKRRRLQLYVFVLRCVAYPFSAKQSTDTQKRQMKITVHGYNQLKDRFNRFLAGDYPLQSDEAFANVAQQYFNVFLRSDRVLRFVKSGGCCSTDLKEVWRSMIEKRIRQLPEIQGVTKETVQMSWITRFDTLLKGDEDVRKQLQPQKMPVTGDAPATKEHLYDMFLNILSIKKFEHQLLYNALQLDNADEQASQIRRELDARLQQCDSLVRDKKLPKFIVKEMESMYKEELQSNVAMLKANLEALPVAKGSSESKYSLNKFKRSRNPSNSMMDSGEDQEASLSKSDIILSFSIEVTVHEVKNLKITGSKIIYCTMEVEGSSKLQTDQAEASRPMWDSQAEFQTSQPLPVVKVKLYTEATGILSLEDTELGKITIRPTPNFRPTAEWHKLTSSDKKSGDNLMIKLTIKVDKPQNLKQCGYMYCLGQSAYRKWKKRFMVLVQVSQYTFALCSYREKKFDPSDIMRIDGYTVDYYASNIQKELQDLEGGKFFFNAVKAGDHLIFSTDEDQERVMWVQALYRSTGQTHKPTPPASSSKMKNAELSKTQGAIDRASKQGMDEFIQANPLKFDHTALFSTLQKLTLDYRLADPYCSMGWLSTGQVYVIDEYCSRYGVRGCHRHLSYLSDLLDNAENGILIDPTLLHYCFAFCACHVKGNRPDGVGTVTQAEQERYNQVKKRLRNFLEYQISNYRYCFPFGRPEGALKATVSLLDAYIRVEKAGITNFKEILMKEPLNSKPNDEMKRTIRKCLEEAALNNYEKISSYVRIEDTQYSEQVLPKAKLDNLTRLAELCVEMMEQNDEYHSDAFMWFTDLRMEHIELFWSLFEVDMKECLQCQEPDTWDSFPLFQTLNDSMCANFSLKNGKFHSLLRDLFAPQVIRYVDLMEASIEQTISRKFDKEKWDVHGNGCATSEDILWKLDALQSFIRDLKWPDEEFAEHLQARLKQVAADMIEAVVTKTIQAYEATLQKGNIFGKSTDYILPAELCVMINVVLDAHEKVDKLCMIPHSDDPERFHTKINDYINTSLASMQASLINRYSLVLEGVLSNLSRYDEGSITGTFFSFTRALTSKAVNAVSAQFSPQQQAKPGAELAISYVTFVRDNVEALHEKIPDEGFISEVCEQWYTSYTSMVSDWLLSRKDLKLQIYQLVCLITIIKKVYGTFQLHGLLPSTLKSSTYDSVKNRLHLEEATASISGANLTCGSIDELDTSSVQV